MSWPCLWRAAVAIMAVAVLGQTSQSQARQGALAEFHESLPARYPDVEHIEAAAITPLDRDAVILFDVRPEKEFAVSHLPGAIRVDPDMTATDFLARYGAQLEERKPVFYCSVGERSSKLAQAIKTTGQIDGPVYNLQDGIFGWHNEGRPLTDAAGPTEFVHPFNRFWGRMLTRRDKIRKKVKR